MSHNGYGGSAHFALDTFNISFQIQVYYPGDTTPRGPLIYSKMVQCQLAVTQDADFNYLLNPNNSIQGAAPNLNHPTLGVNDPITVGTTTLQLQAFIELKTTSSILPNDPVLITASAKLNIFSGGDPVIRELDIECDASFDTYTAH